MQDFTIVVSTEQITNAAGERIHTGEVLATSQGTVLLGFNINRTFFTAMIDDVQLAACQLSAKSITKPLLKLKGEAIKLFSDIRKAKSQEQQDKLLMKMTSTCLRISELAGITRENIEKEHFGCVNITQETIDEALQEQVAKSRTLQ